MELIASFISLNVSSASCAEALMAKLRSKSGTAAVSEIKQTINRIMEPQYGFMSTGDCLWGLTFPKPLAPQFPKFSCHIGCLGYSESTLPS